MDLLPTDTLGPVKPYVTPGKVVFYPNSLIDTRLDFSPADLDKPLDCRETP